MEYEVIKIDERFIESVKFWNEAASYFLNDCLNKNLWIAGGFARKLYDIYTFKKNIDISLMNYFFYESGDIDVFGKKENLECFQHICDFKEDDGFYENKYTLNMTFCCFDELLNKDLAQSSRRTKIVIQLVNKIIHKSIFDCLDSFDITNCKYGVYKENNNFFLTFNKDACYYDNKKELDISHSNTPYLAQRIVKYIKCKNLKKISDRSREKIKTYFINVISNNWADYIDKLSDVYISKIYRDIITLDNLISLSEEEIIIMLGKIKVLKHNDDYSSYVSKDWTLEKIRGKNK